MYRVYGLRRPCRSRVGRPTSSLLHSALAGDRRLLSGSLFERVIWIDGWLLRLSANGVSGNLFFFGARFDIARLQGVVD